VAKAITDERRQWRHRRDVDGKIRMDAASGRRTRGDRNNDGK
jgi:hypothetical protein